MGLRCLSLNPSDDFLAPNILPFVFAPVNVFLEVPALGCGCDEIGKTDFHFGRSIGVLLDDDDDVDDGCCCC